MFTEYNAFIGTFFSKNLCTKETYSMFGILPNVSLRTRMVSDIFRNFALK